MILGKIELTFCSLLFVGVLLVPVISTDRKSPCYLTILNAQTMEEMAKCDVPISTVIPTSFHGFFDQKV